MILQKLFKGYWLLAIICICGLTSCGNNGCEETRQSYLTLSLKATGRINLSKIAILAIGEKGDSLMYSASKPTDISLALRPDTTFTQFQVITLIEDNGDDEQYIDTVSISYSTTPHFIDMECGCSVFFDIKEALVTKHLFKSVNIKNKSITNDENVHLILSY